MLEYTIDLLNHYGYMALFVVLMLELIVLSTLGELLMNYCGFLVYEGKLYMAFLQRLWYCVMQNKGLELCWPL
jgi:membrane protein DedA with SNARE-associated domain